MKDKLKNKKVIAGIIGVTAVIGIIVFIFLNTNSSILQLRNKTVTVEYGQKISLEAKDYLKDDLDSKIIAGTKATIKEDVVIDDKKEYLAIGEYTVVLTYEKDTTEVKVIVKDTTAPTFKDFKDSVEVAKDVKPDYSRLYAAVDLSEVNISCDDANVKYDFVGEYKATIKATDTSKNEVTKEITVKITEPSIKLDKDVASLYVKETLVLKVTILGKDQKAVFKSSNEKIATVDAEGKITAKAIGTVTITASANGKDTACKLTVKNTPSGSTTKKDTNGNTVVVPPSSNNNSSGSSNTSDGTAKISMEAFNLINSERAKLGLEKISYASNLEGTALSRAKALTKNFSHNGSGSSYDIDTGIGRSEVITQLNSVNNATRAVSNWMNSKAHRNAIMSERNISLIVAYCDNCWVAIFIYGD